MICNTLMHRFRQKQYYYDSSDQILFHYGKRPFVMSKLEQELYEKLLGLFGGEYYVFPQMHLSSIFEGRVGRKSFMTALRHINQKSVDYVICRRKDTQPLVAIELDGWSHQLYKKHLRDIEVNRIAEDAGLPILHFSDIQSMTRDEIKERVVAVLPLRQNQTNTTIGRT